MLLNFGEKVQFYMPIHGNRRELPDQDGSVDREEPKPESRIIEHVRDKARADWQPQ